MIHTFLDASVLFAAAFSETGASREIIRRAIRGEVRLVVTRLVFEEAKRNLQQKAPKHASELERFQGAVEFEMVRPTRREVEEAREYTVTKDAPIVAAAKHAQVDYLVTLDRRHLVDVAEVAKRSGLKIVLPEEALRQIRAEEK